MPRGAMFGFRVLRFGAEAALAAKYGRQIVAWMASDLFRDIAYFFTAIVLIGSVITAIQFVRTIRRHSRRSAQKRAAYWLFINLFQIQYRDKAHAETLRYHHIYTSTCEYTLGN